jgi:hypothetical protein
MVTMGLYKIEPPWISISLTAFMLWRQYWRHFWGSFFYGGISPSKIGLIAPYWEPVQALSKARVFLPGGKKSRLVCTTVTDCAKSRTIPNYGRATRFNAPKRCRIEPGTCIMAISVPRLSIFIFRSIKNERYTLSIEPHVVLDQMNPTLNREGVELMFNKSYRFEERTHFSSI